MGAHITAWRLYRAFLLHERRCFPLQEQNITNCKENLKQNQKDLELIKDSITTTEVKLTAVNAAPLVKETLFTCFCMGAGQHC